MTINGSTNSSAWTYKLEVTETSTSVQDRTSTVQVKAYLGRANSQSYLGGGYSVSVTCAGASQTQSGTIAYPTYINGGAWLLLKTFTFTVSNTGNPTTISISSSMSSGDFTPSSASASGTMSLTILHLSPTIETAEVSELNTVVSNLGVPATTVVRYLSKKRFTLHATAYDSATLSYRILGFLYRPDWQSSNIFDVDFRTDAQDVTFNNNTVQLTQYVKDSLNGEANSDIKVLINNTESLLNIIDYAKPTLERTATTIKRKSGNGTNLVDNKANINVVGTIYKANNAIGNNNAIRTIGYKVWERDTSEPANYTSFSTTPTPSSTGAVTITNYEISNIDFRKAYNYKIILQDTYSDGTNYYSDVAEGTIPLGQPTWTEYKDRVDFLALTVGGYNPFEYPDTEIKCGVWLNKPLYRKVIDVGYLPNSTSDTINHSISNVARFTKVYGTATRASDKDTLPIPYVTFNANNSGGISVYANDTSITIRTTTDRSSYYAYIILEYTKTTD